MIAAIQDDDLAKADLRRHDRLKAERAPYEDIWRQIDERFPDGAGGFDRMSPGGVRGAKNFDTTHITANERFAAAGVAITTPQERDYIKPRFADAELMKDRDVLLWCEKAGQRQYAVRHAWHTGFGISVNEDWDQLGRYGTSAVLTDVRPDRRGLYYRTFHLSEIWIDTDFNGMVDTVHRQVCKPVREIEQEFGEEALTPKMRDALAKDGGEITPFELLFVVAPNTTWDRDTFDHRRFPIASRVLAIDEKIYLRRKGYYSMPISVSRHTTSPREKYGRSPGIKMLPTIGGANAMKHTTLRAAHKAVDPALLFNNEDNVSKLASKPGGMNPGFVDDMGRAMVARMPGGENGIPFALEMIAAEQQEIKTAFLEEFYKILTDPNSRMTTVEVLEVMAKQGVLVRPFASRYETEKQQPLSNRELDLALREDHLMPELPDVVKEVGAWPLMEYDNMLAAMARAESTGKTLRWIETLTAMATGGKTDAYDWIDDDVAIPGMAAEIGVKASYVRDPKTVAAIREGRQQEKQAELQGQQIQQVADAYQSFAKGNQLSEAA
ncbi:portal protein [Novosphingobium sp.]|uniref:portal protein n=1 Tax=Novosphingobium sp. TaxID=1874826 RepID=UPI00286D8A6A|nr:portal protein [Novosphingobium sp.]